MSCGGHHEVDCTSVLAALDAFIDGEDSEVDRATIAQHLVECGPCLREEQVENLIKERVARACRDEQCSEQLRARVVTRIREIHVDVTSSGVRTTSTTITSISSADQV